MINPWGLVLALMGAVAAYCFWRALGRPTLRRSVYEPVAQPRDAEERIAWLHAAADRLEERGLQHSLEDKWDAANRCWKAAATHRRLAETVWGPVPPTPPCPDANARRDYR